MINIKPTNLENEVTVSNGINDSELKETLRIFIPNDIFDVQEILLQIWHELLPSISSFQLQDDFKSLGGDSVFAMRVISRVWDVFGIELSPGMLFDLNNIEALSEFIAKKLSISAD